MDHGEVEDVCGVQQQRRIGPVRRITPEFGVIEVGHIWLGEQLKRTAAATEAIYLLAAHVFDDLGYRRLEWKCNALNKASRRAAARFGFSFEGIFRNHVVVKGRNRDTAWYAITDHDWQAVRTGFLSWLALLEGVSLVVPFEHEPEVEETPTCSCEPTAVGRSRSRNLL
jgi:hypothetical protein